MKRLLLIVFALGFAVQGWGQQTITGKYYIANVDIPLRAVSINGDSINQTVYILRAGTKFTGNDILENKGVLIKPWNFKRRNDTTQRQPASIVSPNKVTYISKETDDMYFLINTKDFNEKVSDYYGKKNSFTWGFTILPIKLRFGGSNRSFRYQEGFSIGINAGYERQFSSRKLQSLGLLIGVGVSSININPEDSNMYLDNETTVGAFTPSVGIVYSYESFQLGVFTGMDIFGGELSKNWVYRNSPWLGIGLGFTIFQKNKTDNNGANQQNK